MKIEKVGRAKIEKKKSWAKIEKAGWVKIEKVGWATYKALWRNELLVEIAQIRLLAASSLYFATYNPLSVL